MFHQKKKIYLIRNPLFMNIYTNFKKLIKQFQLYKYNEKNQTQIESLSASLKASYGKHVNIAPNTTVEDSVSIGDFSYINTNSYVENCIIGKFCSISSGVHISPIEHQLGFITTHPITDKIDTSRYHRNPVVIGNDVLICLNVTILEGISIGNGAVIGAGAVVTRNVLPYEVVGGIPAKHIKFRFSNETIEYLQNLSWWDWDIEKINNNLEFLSGLTNQIIE